MEKEQQVELFDDEHAAIGELFDNLDSTPLNEVEHRWPKILVEIIDVLSCELERQEFAKKEAKLTACKLVGVMAHYFGGNAVYLPSGEKMEKTLREVQMYNDFTGNNVHELVRKYRVSQTNVYDIIRRQRALQRKRHQNDLPF